MSDTKESNVVAEARADQAAAKGGVGLVPLVLIVLGTVMMVLGAVGGGLYWLTRSGGLAALPGGAVSAAQVPAKVEPPKTRMVLLDPLLVNLADPGGAGYLRVVVAFEVEDPPPAKDAKAKEEKPPEKGKVVVNEDEVKMRDAALAALGHETSETLLAPDGKEALKKTLRQAISANVPEMKVVNVMFTEFLVQR